jgi:hypothetical protein
MHARFWDSGRRDTATNRAVWLGAVSLDVGIEVLRHGYVPVGTTHHIDPDLDAARDLLLLSLLEAGQVRAAARRTGIGPTPDGRNGGGDIRAALAVETRAGSRTAPCSPTRRYRLDA